MCIGLSGFLVLALPMLVQTVGVGRVHGAIGNKHLAGGCGNMQPVNVFVLPYLLAKWTISPSLFPQSD
jgi:hypothetical protein